MRLSVARAPPRSLNGITLSRWESFMDSCTVCGQFAWYHVTDSRGVVAHYCETHAPEAEPALAKLDELAPPIMSGVPYVNRCERCGGEATFHVTQGPVGQVRAQAFCENCAPRHARII
jgi:hypothetical protein